MTLGHEPADRQELSVTFDRQHGTTVITVSGEIDVATGTKLRAGLATHLDDAACPEVIVDLRAVTFMSSTGIAALVDADYQARQRRKALRIVAGDNRAVWTPLRLSGVDKMLRLQTDPGMDPT